jgi:hypothetical protein
MTYQVQIAENIIHYFAENCKDLAADVAKHYGAKVEEVKNFANKNIQNKNIKFDRRVTVDYKCDICNTMIYDPNKKKK